MIDAFIAVIVGFYIGAAYMLSNFMIKPKDCTFLDILVSAFMWPAELKEISKSVKEMQDLIDED